MDGKKCGAECMGCASCKGGACGGNACGSCEKGSCGMGCGCGHRGVRILVKILVLGIVFWAGMELGEQRALTGAYRGYPTMMRAGALNFGQ